MPNTVSTLKSLYNIIQQNVMTWQNSATNATNALDKTIALAKVESYQDCATTVLNLLQGMVPPYG